MTLSDAWGDASGESTSLRTRSATRPMPGSFLIRVRNRVSMKVEVEVRVRVEHSAS